MRAGHGDEGDPVPPPGASASIVSLIARTSRGPANVMAPGQRRLRPGAEGQEQPVVADRRPVAGLELARAGADALDDVRDPAHAAIAGDLLPVVVAARARPERLGDRQRPVGDVTSGGDDADVEAIPGEVLERQEPFEGADATAGDDDMWGHSHTVAPPAAADIGVHPRPDP